MNMDFTRGFAEALIAAQPAIDRNAKVAAEMGSQLRQALEKYTEAHRAFLAAIRARGAEEEA